MVKMKHVLYGYAVEYRKIESEEWKNFINDDMGVCYKTFGGATDAVRRLKGVLDEKKHAFLIIPLYIQQPTEPTTSEYSRDEESQIM